MVACIPRADWETDVLDILVIFAHPLRKTCNFFGFSDILMIGSLSVDAVGDLSLPCQPPGLVSAVNSLQLLPLGD